MGDGQRAVSKVGAVDASYDVISIGFNRDDVRDLYREYLRVAGGARGGLLGFGTFCSVTGGRGGSVCYGCGGARGKPVARQLEASWCGDQDCGSGVAVGCDSGGVDAGYVDEGVKCFGARSFVGVDNAVVVDDDGAGRCGGRSGVSELDGGQVRGKWYALNKKKRERKMKAKMWEASSWRTKSDSSSCSDTTSATVSDEAAKESLRRTWVLKNELEATRLQREIEIAKSFDVEAEIKRRQSAVRKQTEQNLAETEKHHRFLVRTGNVPGEGRPDGVKVVNGKRMREVIVDGEVKYEEEGVSGGGYVEGTVLESCTIQPSSSASMKEYMAEKKRAEDEEKKRKDAEAKVKVLERQLASAGIGVKRDEVGNTEYSFSDGGDVTYRGKLQAAYRGKVVRVVKDSYGVPAVENVMAGAFEDGSDTLSNMCIREVERYEEEVRRSKCL